MSINGLSNHLYLVATIIINLIIATLVYQTACTTANTYDYAESRQFRRNLAASKHRNNTYWLPNYRWKQPEKFYGLRKKPAWEVNRVAESWTEKKKRKEFEEWADKMREVTKREREKWRNYEIDEQPQPTLLDKLSTSFGDILKRNTENKESEVLFDNNFNNQPYETINLKKNLHNGRWGMTANLANEQSFENAPKTLNANSKNSHHEEKTFTSTFPSGRWGLSIKRAPKEFLEEISLQSEIQKSNSLMEQHDNQTTPSQSENEKGIDIKSLGKKTKINQSKIKESDITEQSIQTSLKKIYSNMFEEQNTVPTTLPPGRLGIDVKEPPKEFLEETERSSQTSKIPDEVQKLDEDRTHAGNKKCYGVQEDRGMRTSTMTGVASPKLSNGLPTARQSMSESFPPREFLREIWRPSHMRFVGFYKPYSLRQLVENTIPINDSPSSKLTFYQTPRVQNVHYLPSFSRILGIRLFPKYLLNPRILRIPTNPCKSIIFR